MVDDEIALLRESARRSAALGNRHVSNLSNSFAIQDYQQMANEIAALAGGGRLLDWGCGYGHMSWLLRRRGFEVVSLTVPDANNLSDSWNLLVREQGLRVIVAEDDVVLPFDDESFDVVLSCGVLEHVPDELRSVSEIARILRPGGYFLVYQLPNWLSVVEWLSERLVGIAHERRYKLRQVAGLFAGTGLAIKSSRHGSMIPKNLDRLPLLRRLFDNHYHLVAGLDSLLLRVPLLSLLSGTWEIVAQKAPAPVLDDRTPAQRDPVTAQSGSHAAHRR